MAKSAEKIIEENLEALEEWAFQGMSEKDMAECLGIGYSTFRKAKKENIALIALLNKSAKKKRDEQQNKLRTVEKSLYERAKGYNYETIEYVKVKSSGYDANGKKWEKEEVVEKPRIVHVPADVQAAKFYLINKSKREWMDNPQKVENDKENIRLRKKEISLKEF